MLASNHRYFSLVELSYQTDHHILQVALEKHLPRDLTGQKLDLHKNCTNPNDIYTQSHSVSAHTHESLAEIYSLALFETARY